MRILLVNPPYQTLTSNLGVGHQIPLGLLMVGGPLLDAGYEVQLLDAECLRLSLPDIIRAIKQFEPHVVMTGHAGSTPAHPICVEMLRAIKTAFPQVITVYGGVYPTYHAKSILQRETCVDVIIRGEGEAGALELVEALAGQDRKNYRPTAGQSDLSSCAAIPGLALRLEGQAFLTNERPVIRDLDNWRVGWELIDDWDRYQCFGLGRAAILQFSRGCPHRCTYCGQHGFWVNWRHRDPVKFVDEIERLYHEHNIRFFTLADENPTTNKEIWRAMLDALASRALPVHFFATIRATDIVRDADILPLYKKAGLLYVLMGIETTDPAIIRQIRKGSTTRHDFTACRLLKQHGIFSVLGHIVGLDDDSFAGFRTALKQLRLYDGDYLNAMYVTPHSWTQFAHDAGTHPIVQKDQRKWDYRHQVLAQPQLKPWQLFLAVKWLELCFHLHPVKLARALFQRDAFARRQVCWSFSHTSLVWLGEIGDFLFNTRYEKSPVPLAEANRLAELPIIISEKF